jgi:methionyl-tRNA formyltransferase
VACGSGSLLLTELQKAGGKRLPVAQFLVGHGVAAGARFELPAA